MSVMFLILTIFLSTSLSSEMFLDLREMNQDFVLETRKIDIPCYPDAFNPSLIRWRGSLLMSFRAGGYQDASDEALLMSFRIRDPQDESTNDIGLVLLDEDFNLLSAPQVLKIPGTDAPVAIRKQDPRLVRVGTRVYIVYSNMIEALGVDYTRRMFVSEVCFDGNHFFALEPQCLSQFEGEAEQRWQKNWVPFDYEGRLLLAYSIAPHKIFYPLLHTGSCETIACTGPDVPWDFGVLRGGTPALREGGEYLGFFHSSKEMKTVQSEGKKISHYFMGAYLFSSRPPFAVTRISPRPIVAESFYDGPAHKTWKPLRVVFPGGFISDDKYVWIAYGKQDHEIWVAKLDKQALLSTLVPVP